eukprot:TRINITY_DN10931_c0_g1_i1.p1 TRINITY_DN10931_c0_g1~~TRINITY_DN10931_c0_g1_i1.p1  ORF type:complete len:857 (+),score=215.00 TRINITY_DN10931_c0_g1_i1:129-2699(+)
MAVRLAGGCRAAGQAAAQPGASLNALLQQRRALNVRGGKGSIRQRSLIDAETGRQEPGFLPPQVMWGSRNTKPHDTWGVMEGKDPSRYFDSSVATNVFLGRNFTVKRQRYSAKRITPEGEGDVHVKDGGWDNHISDIRLSVPSGLDWVDPQDPELRNYENWTQTSPESTLLHPHICAALRSLGISELTRPQVASLYYMRRGRDVFLQSHPGTGKTSAVMWHVLNKLLKEYPNAPNSTVWLVPTENLAYQALRNFHTLGKLVGVIDESTFCVCVDSKDLERNFEEVMQRRPSIIIGTPNRIGDLIHTPNSPLYDMERTTLARIIIDEVEAVVPPRDLTTMGWSLLYSLSNHRRWRPGNMFYGQIPSQKVFISSTMPQTMQWHLRDFVSNQRCRTVSSVYGVDSLRRPRPVDYVDRFYNHHIDVFHPENPSGSSLNQSQRPQSYGGLGLQKDISHVCFSCELPLGVRNIAKSDANAYRYKAAAAVVKAMFDKQNGVAQASPVESRVFFRGLLVVANGTEARLLAEELDVVGFGGKVGRLENQTALRSYANGLLPLLITTPAFIRGMDLPHLTHVFIATKLPNDPTDYIRMAGRVGRAGKHGVVVSICLPSEVKTIKDNGYRLGFEPKLMSTRSLGVEWSQKLLPEGGKKLDVVREKVLLPSGFVQQLPLARKLKKGESKDVDRVDGRAPSSTGEAEVTPIKGMLIDDEEAVDTFIDSEDPHALQVLDNSRNIVQPDGSLKPDLAPHTWPAGASSGIFYDDEEKAAIHSANVHRWLSEEKPEKGQPSLEPDQNVRPVPSVSLHPDMAKRDIFQNANKTRPASVKEHLSPINESLRFLRLVDVRTGKPLGSVSVEEEEKE